MCAPHLSLLLLPGSHQESGVLCCDDRCASVLCGEGACPRVLVVLVGSYVCVFTCSRCDGVRAGKPETVEEEEEEEEEEVRGGGEAHDTYNYRACTHTHSLAHSHAHTYAHTLHLFLSPLCAVSPCVYDR